MSLGLFEIVAIAVVALLFFGPSRLPSLGKSVGEAIRGFKKGIEGLNDEINDDSSKKPAAPVNKDSSDDASKKGHES